MSVIMNIGRIIHAGNSGTEAGLAESVGVGVVVVGVEVGFAEEPVLGVGEGVEETPFKVTIIVALSQVTLTPKESVLSARRLPPAIVIWDVPVPVTRKVKVARTPEDSTDVPSIDNASVNPPSIKPLVLSHSCFEFPTKKVDPPPVLSVRKGPS